MTPERWAAAQQLFEAALVQPPHERTAFVDREAADADLAALVRGLLDADAVEQSGADSLADVVSRAVDEVTSAQAAAPIAERLGPYRILSVIGQGGMGAVYLAERDDDEFLQRVAVKVVRGVLDAERVRQFRTERQILAWLEHPHIARLLDGGTTPAGLPYLVMEHVEGVPIDRHCDERTLGVADRLRLFLRVCDAVSHAHRSLIVHRDIKPSNILVTAGGVPKLLDFGIARLALDGVNLETGGAAPGRMMTPDYASPEVVRGGPVTTAADVYALGVLLYELLTGRRPLRFSTMSTAEIERVVCHVDPPPASVAATTDSDPPGISAAARAAARGTTPARLRAALKGDLDAILAKAMAKEAADRYPSVEAFADDLRRHLDGTPIAALPTTWAYTARRFVARHRWSTAAAAAVLAAVTAAVIGLSLQATRLAGERDRAERERDAARQDAAFLSALFDGAAAGGGADAVTARELLNRGVERLDVELAGQPVVQARRLHAMAAIYAALRVHDRAAALYQRARDLRRTTLGAEHADTAASMHGLAESYRQLGRLADAESLHRETLALRRRLDAAPGSIAESLAGLASTLSAGRRHDEAGPLFQEALALRRAVHGPEHPVVARALYDLARVQLAQGRLQEAEPAAVSALQIRRRVLPAGHAELADSLELLGELRAAQGHRADADRLLAEARAMQRTPAAVDAAPR